MPITIVPITIVPIAYVTIGLPGCGKSTWAEGTGLPVVERDLGRFAITGSYADHSQEQAVTEWCRTRIRLLALEGVEGIVVSDTNIQPRHRKNLFQYLRELGYSICVVVFDVPVDVCIERNKNRERAVPEAVIHRMAAQLHHPLFISPVDAVEIRRAI